MDATVGMLKDDGSDGDSNPPGQQKKRPSARRVQLDLPERSMERLNALKDKTESSSYAEVIRNALRLYEDMVHKAESGREFLIRDPSGNITPYEVFLRA